MPPVCPGLTDSGNMAHAARMSVGCSRNPQYSCPACAMVFALAHRTPARPGAEELLRLVQTSNPFSRIEDREDERRRQMQTR